VWEIYRRFRTAWLLPDVTPSLVVLGVVVGGVKVDARDSEAWSMFTLTTRGAAVAAVVGQAGGSNLADPAVCRCQLNSPNFPYSSCKNELILLMLCCYVHRTMQMDMTRPASRPRHSTPRTARQAAFPSPSPARPSSIRTL